MAKKIRCAQCGAKNGLDVRRCRICGTLINADVVEVPEGAAHGRFVGAGEGGPPSDEQLRNMGYDVKAVQPTDEPVVVAPDEHFDPNEFEMPWTAQAAPPPPTKDAPVVEEFERFDPNDLKIEWPTDPK